MAGRRVCLAAMPVKGRKGRKGPKGGKRLMARVCVVSIEVNGPCRNGGIGTAYTALAEQLARAGHTVTILYLLGKQSEDRPIRSWVRDFRRRGIELVPLQATSFPLGGSRSLRLSYRAHEWLAEQERAGRGFDIIHFHEWLGFGYFTLLAKHQGRNFASSTICVGIHSPTRWMLEA